MSTELKYGNKKFVCPHCNALAKQDWFNSYILGENVAELYEHLYLNYREKLESYQQKHIRGFLNTVKSTLHNNFNNILPSSLSISKCQACDDFSLWVNKEIVYPRNLSVDNPNADMNEDIQDLYNEASKIFLDSPKGATAILRLALQKLLIQLGEDGKIINNNIKTLVANGLNPKMQKALDVVRVVGNNAVHPGEINLDDNKEIALRLFKIINLLADDMITKPKDMDDLYDEMIPDETKKHIEQRDGR